MKEYSAAKYVMPPVIMGACFQFAYSMYVNLEMYKKKTFMISIGTILVALINIPLNYFFIEKFGYIAAAYTTMFCCGLLFAFHYIITLILKMSNIYDNRYNFIILFIMCCITILMEYIYI